jgi:hypothetical protein
MQVTGLLVDTNDIYYQKCSNQPIQPQNPASGEEKLAF